MMATSNVRGFIPLVHDLSNVDQMVRPGGYHTEYSQGMEINNTDIKIDKSSASPSGTGLSRFPEHNSNAVDLDDEILRLGSDHDDEPEVIDISMWTQNRPSTSSSSRQIRPSNSLGGSFVTSLHDAAGALNNSHSDSAESESGEIPFISKDMVQPDMASETINVRPSTASGPSKQSNSMMLKPIGLLEGSPSLQSLPSYLHDQLMSYCHRKGTDHPDFIKTKWPRSNINHSAIGNKTWFETPQGQGPLSAARFQYGLNGQFIIIQDDLTNEWNGGRAAIMIHDPSRISHREVSGTPCVLHKWQIWDPLGNSSPPPWCWRVIQQTASQASRTKAQSASSTPQVQKKPAADLRAPRTVPAKRVQPSKSTEILRGDDAFDALRGIKRSSSAMDLDQPAEKIRLSAANAKRVLALIDRPPPSTVGARRDEASGEIWLRRRSDGVVVVLRCCKCASAVVNTEQGLFNHFKSVHDIHFLTRIEMADYCGIPVDEMALRMGEPVSLGKPAAASKPNIKTVTTTSPHTRPLQRPPQRIATPPRSVEPHDNSSHDAQFVFLKTPADPNPRTRSLSAVGTVDKLFVNALVAGVAKKDTLILTITIENAEPFHVVKGDKEDFGLILERIKESRYKNPVITVTSEDWE